MKGGVAAFVVGMSVASSRSTMVNLKVIMLPLVTDVVPFGGSSSLFAVLVPLRVTTARPCSSNFSRFPISSTSAFSFMFGHVEQCF